MDDPPYLRRLSRTCGVLVLVVVFFAPWCWWHDDERNELHTWASFFSQRWEELTGRGLELPGRALDPRSSSATREHAIWSMEAPIVVSMLGLVPASAAALLLAPRRRTPRLPLFAAVAGTTASSTLVARFATSELGFASLRFDDPVGELTGWPLASLLLGFGAAAIFGGWKRRRWGSETTLGVACFGLAAAASPVLFPGMFFRGAHLSALLLALAIVLELARGSPLIDPQPEGSEAARVPRTEPLPRKAANVAALTVFVLSLALVGLLTRRATRPERLNDPYDDWPFFLDVNRPRHGYPRALAFTAKGDLLACVSYDGELRLWSIRDGLLLRTVQLGPRVYELSISPGGDLVATIDNQDDVQVRSTDDGRMIWERPKGGEIGFSPGGDLLAVRGNDKLELLSAKNGTLVSDLITGDFAFSPGGERIAIGRSPFLNPLHPLLEPPARVWSVRDGHEIVALEDGHYIGGLVFSQSGDVVLGKKLEFAEDARAARNLLCAWSATTGALLLKTAPPEGFEIEQVAPDGTRVAISSGKCVYVVPTSKLDSWKPAGHFPIVRNASVLAWSPRDDFLAVHHWYTGGKVELVPVPKKTPDDRELVAAPRSR